MAKATAGELRDKAEALLGASDAREPSLWRAALAEFVATMLFL